MILRIIFFTLGGMDQGAALDPLMRGIMSALPGSVKWSVIRVLFGYYEVTVLVITLHSLF